MWKSHFKSLNGSNKNKPLWLYGITLGLTAALLLSGCGQIGDDSTYGRENSLTGSPPDGNAKNEFDNSTKDGETVMGRYIESNIDMPDELQHARDLWVDDKGLNIISSNGSLYRSQDQGQSWQLISQAPAELQDAFNKETIFYYQQNSMGGIVAGYMVFPKDESGNVSYESSFFQNVLYLSDGTKIILEQLSEQDTIHSAVCDEDGTFYLGSSSHIYRVNSLNGSTEVLADISSSCDYLTICGNYLFIQGQELQLYDLKEGKMSEPDTVLNEFMEPWLGSYGDVGSKPYLFYQSPADDGNIYVLTDKGLYRHTLYGSVMEQIIDGSLCSMSNPSLGYINMLQTDETFMVLYSDGLLKQYNYDANVSAIPENILRVYGLYEDTDIQMVISAYNQKHPELHVTYEHPLSENTGMTKDDAMKTLSTQLAAGNGPDVLLLDGLPFDTYVEKGVLSDLSEMLDGTGEHYMDAVMNSYLRDGKQYAAPMKIQMPVFMGASDKIKGIKSLEQLANLLEETREQQPEGSLIGFYGADEAIELLAPGSMDSWMTEDGKLDKEAVKEFLTQSKRIYETQINGLSSAETERFNELEVNATGVYIDETNLSFQLSNALFFDQPYALGMLDSNASILSTFPMIAEMLKQQEMSYDSMPGQSQCIAEASQIWAVNAASGMQEQAMELVAYALSTQFWKENTLSSATTNWDVFEEQINEALKNEQEYCVGMSMVDIHGMEVVVNSDTPAKEDLDALRAFLEKCQGVSQCDSRIYDAVIEQGQKALTGELTIEEAVKEIENKVSLYLSE